MGKYKVESNRLKDWDYGAPWWYFVTICVYGRQKFLGEVKDHKMILSEVGSIVDQYWQAIPIHQDFVELDEYVIMPNHLHGIIILNESRDVQLNVSTPKQKKGFFSEISPPKKSLSVVIRSFKGAVKKWSAENGFDRFRWQSNYYDHIIRNENDLNRIRRYIEINPVKWEIDKYYNQNE